MELTDGTTRRSRIERSPPRRGHREAKGTGPAAPGGVRHGDADALHRVKRNKKKAFV